MSTSLIPVTVEHEGAPWALWKLSADSKEALAKDLDVACWLGYSDRYMIRRLIERYSDELGGVSVTVAETGLQGGRPGRAFYLTREQALFIAARSETPKATQVLKSMIAVFLKAHDLLTGHTARIAQLELQLRQLRPSALRPTDIAAAWCKAHLEAAPNQLQLTEIYAQYVVWAQEQGLSFSSATMLSGALVRAGLRRTQGGGRVQFLCQFRAEPLQVEMPQGPAPKIDRSTMFKMQQEPLRIEAQAEARQDHERLADRALAVLERHPRGLEAQHMTQILGVDLPTMHAVLGGMVEAGALTVEPKGDRLLYQPTQPERRSELQQQVQAYMQSKTPGERVTTREVIEAVGLAVNRTNEIKVGLTLRALGYERARTATESGWRAWTYAKPEGSN